MAKYIVAVVHAGYVERPVAFVFPDVVSHDDFADSVCRDRHAVISAGFVSIRDHISLPRPYGKSTSLKLDSRPVEDAQYLGEIFGMIEAVPFEIQTADKKLVSRNRGDAYDHAEAGA